LGLSPNSLLGNLKCLSQLKLKLLQSRGHWFPNRKIFALYILLWSLKVKILHQNGNIHFHLRSRKFLHLLLL